MQVVSKALLLVGIAGMAFLAGCAATKHMSTDFLLPRAKTIGTFELDATVSTVDQLLSRFRERTPVVFKDTNLKDAVFDKDEGLQWAVLSFKHSFIHWKLGVQFVRRPTESGNQVLALVRTTGTMDGEDPDPEKLNSLLPTILAALRAARVP